MPTKKGGGGKSQNYDADNGRFSKENKSSVSGRNETLANALNIYTNTQKNPSVTKKRMALMVRCYCRYKTRNVCA